MKVSELKEKQGNVEVTVEVKNLGEPRDFQKFGKPGRVTSASVFDDSGEIKLTLWNDDVDRIKVGDKLKVTNGFVNVFQGEKQLTAGKFGKIEVLSEDSEKPKKKSKTE